MVMTSLPVLGSGRVKLARVGLVEATGQGIGHIHAQSHLCSLLHTHLLAGRHAACRSQRCRFWS